ncbi:unnamed protein product [Hymenolepis diminuta]|uniref:Glutaredoxin domain-containing protein n=1 Tax=Hymenolepis diminuta TaxID=6216 RepID=A0A0R3SM38_HYMDI|nr:unnamed protein product [Hymenolepis diminuta]
MQRPPSFVLLDAESSSSEHEEIVEYLADMPEEVLSFNISPTLDNSLSKPDTQSEEASLSKNATKFSIKDQNSCSTSTSECADIAEIVVTRSRKNSEVSNISSLSPEEVVIDPILSSDECESRSESRIDTSSQ